MKYVLFSHVYTLYLLKTKKARFEFRVLRLLGVRHRAVLHRTRWTWGDGLHRICTQKSRALGI